MGCPTHITITIQSISSGGANNGGYQTGDNSYIKINFLQAGSAASFATLVTPMLFVNELVEILMDYGSPSGDIWNRGHSDGEGLSPYLGILCFPSAHYAFHTSVVDSWLTSSNGRQDWLDNEGTDTNPASFGCVLMFLNYLNTQLNFSPGDIIKNGGHNPSETYQSLTGDPTRRHRTRAL